MALSDNLTAEKAKLTTLLENEYLVQNLRDSPLLRLLIIRFLLGELTGSGASSQVKELVAATQVRAANVTPYSIGDSYGGRGEFTNVGTVGQSLFINDFQTIFDITAIPSGMALSVRFFTTDAGSQVTGAPVSDNSLLTATLPNAATPADGYPLTLSVVGDKVVGAAKNIKFLTPLEATSIWFYLHCNANFTPAANSETMTAKASCEVY